MTAQERPVSKPSSDAYRDNWEKIFGKKTGNSTRDALGNTPSSSLPAAEDSNTSN